MRFACTADYPWVSDRKLYRQDTAGDWDSVLQRVNGF